MISFEVYSYMKVGEWLYLTQLKGPSWNNFLMKFSLTL